ncbi:MAG: 30S ribosomal protein S20 [Bacillota bacterium]
MPNIKSAEKRLEISRRNKLRNMAAKSAVKTVIKKFESAVASGDQDQAQLAHKEVVRSLDKAVSKGFIHKNTAARKKSRLSKKLKATIS